MSRNAGFRRRGQAAIAATVFAVLLGTSDAVIGVYDEPSAARVQDDDYDAALKTIAAKQWERSIELLRRAAARHPGSADVHSLLGYALRNAGSVEAAFESYGRALRLDPNHRGAHEYIGQAYLLQGRRAQAEHHLRELRRICGVECVEYLSLKASVDAARKPAP